MANVVLYGAEWCPYCKALGAFLDERKIDYIKKDIDDESVKAEMLVKTQDKNLIPTLEIDGEIFQNPDHSTVAEKLGFEMTTENSDNKMHDVIMIGAGPSALSAAIYTTREDLDTVLLEKGVIGGLAAITDWVDNYPGFVDGVAGLALAEQLEGQAKRFGADIQFGEVTHIEDMGEYKKVTTTDGEWRAKSVLIATGSDYKKLGVPGEETYYGRGVHYCATCDGAFYREKKLVVVGGGNSGVQEALFLTRFSSHIDLLVRSTVKASEVLQHELDKMVAEGKITVHLNTTTNEIIGHDKGITTVKATKEGLPIEFNVDGMFVFIGLLPNTDFLKNTAVKLDEYGMVLTDQYLMTSIRGVFASGDVRSGATAQIASATGEGATAALKIREYLENRI